MAWKFVSDRPIYLQIAEHIKIDIITGVYPPGERLPSVRELAAIAAVNPNTMQRAMSELEQSGLVSAMRTTGRFVTEDKEILEKTKQALAHELAQEYLRTISRLGYTPEEAAELVLKINQ
ncbi:MAG TPA: GntR family transcriptional regulator [Bacillota bacterium]|nr:GntR family transcriptional regulator [Bacillota bacterium]HOK67994.1 GntR family transcriptional regulator [Bacillota bacterium]HPP84540.1 GntR family transcriptional regulator [Bacillota bacterium]